MTTKYRFKLSPADANLEINWKPIIPSTWVDKNVSAKLVSGAGLITEGRDGLICDTGELFQRNPVITLIGASWESKVGDTGEATCHLCQDTPDEQTWELVSKE